MGDCWVIYNVLAILTQLNLKQVGVALAKGCTLCALDCTLGDLLFNFPLLNGHHEFFVLTTLPLEDNIFTLYLH